jgi:hypothetical protein
MSSTSLPPCRFLTLPAETRVSIYEFIFLDNCVQIKTKKRLWEVGWSWREIHRVGCCQRHQILLTCRQCYREGRGMWYSSTTWDFSSLTVRPFLDAANARPYLACIKYVQLRDVHDLTQLWPGLLPSLRYVVAGTGVAKYRVDRKSFEDMGVEEIFQIVRNYLFREKEVKTRICAYLYHDGEGQKFPRKRSFCLHFRISIVHYPPRGHNTRSQTTPPPPPPPTIWSFLVDLDANTVEKRSLGAVHSALNLA